ncbi:hypothetical protein Scep_001558 [Stephania cephalantha]|uniref:Uncharacterized protein n=1 Tax=Stephania cephalantha TaxID=152367 RepID=A0AAP0L9M2_9MAGN
MHLPKQYEMSVQAYRRCTRIWAACSKRASEVALKTESSRRITMKFMDMIDSVVDECDWSLYEQTLRKVWKGRTCVDKVNLDDDQCFSSPL